MIVRNWAEQNWSETSHWIDTLSGDVRDKALVAALNREGTTDSESLSIAMTIGNPEMRNEEMEGVIRTWSYSDSDAAESWVKSSGLSPEQQQHLFSVISDVKAAQNATEATAEQ